MFLLRPSLYKNTVAAFERALESGFGIETDFRDFNGELVVSHDPANAASMKADVFFDLCNRYPNANPHAINIKSDGLQKLLTPHFDSWKKERYFVFDMSVPDSLGYLNLGINTYVRVSEYESYQDFGGQASGIWLDGFHEDWYGIGHIRQYLKMNKPIAIVSSELHGRDHRGLWAMIKSLHTPIARLMLCTDFPIEAKNYFS